MDEPHALVIDILRRAGLASSHPVVRAVEGHSHRVFEVDTGAQHVAVKIAAGPGGFSRAATLAAQEAGRLGIGPEPLFVSDDGSIRVETWVERSTPLSHVAARLPSALAACAAIRSFHDGCRPIPAHLDAPRAIEDLIARPSDAGDWRSRLPAPGRVNWAWRTLQFAGPAVPSHGDLAAGNVLVSDRGEIRLIDWEYAAMAPRAWDIGYLAVEAGLDPREDAAALAMAYGSPLDAGLVREAMLVASVLNMAWRAATPGDIGNESPGVAERLSRLESLVAVMDETRA